MNNSSFSSEFVTTFQSSDAQVPPRVNWKTCRGTPWAPWCPSTLSGVAACPSVAARRWRWRKPCRLPGAADLTWLWGAQNRARSSRSLESPVAKIMGVSQRGFKKHSKFWNFTNGCGDFQWRLKVHEFGLILVGQRCFLWAHFETHPNVLKLLEEAGSTNGTTCSCRMCQLWFLRIYSAVDS